MKMTNWLIQKQEIHKKALWKRQFIELRKTRRDSQSHLLSDTCKLQTEWIQFYTFSRQSEEVWQRHMLEDWFFTQSKGLAETVIIFSLLGP